jgi:hypothetical protein
VAKPYRTAEAQILAKVEATPGTAETLATADQFIAQNVKLSLSIADTANGGQTGVLSKEPGVSGIQTGTLSFDVVLKGSGAVGTAPEWRAAALAAGCSETIVGATSVTYKPAAPESYFTFGVIFPGLGGVGEDVLFRLAGCQGNMKITLKAGELMMANFTMTGVYAAPADGSVVTPPTWQTSVPYAFLNPVMTFHGTSALAFETLAMDMGNTVAIRSNANGTTGALTAQITGRRVVGSVDFEMDKLATFNPFTKVTTNATGAVAMTPIGTAGNLLALTMPKIRFMSPDLGDRAGSVTVQAKYEALRSANAGNDEFSLAMT